MKALLCSAVSAPEISATPHLLAQDFYQRPEYRVKISKSYTSDKNCYR
jgi:hypothetical protein